MLGRLIDLLLQFAKLIKKSEKLPHPRFASKIKTAYALIIKNSTLLTNDVSQERSAEAILLVKLSSGWKSGKEKSFF